MITSPSLSDVGHAAQTPQLAGPAASAQHDTLYDDPDLYDQLCAALPDSAELSFYATLAESTGNPQCRVLELGCGTGRLSLPLAYRGCQVTGLDASPPMLALARSKAHKRGLTVDLREADIRDFSLGGPGFDMIMLPNNTLGHMLSFEETLSCLRCAREHLADDGLLVVDMFNPSVSRLAVAGEQAHALAQFTSHQGEPLEACERARYDPVSQTSQIHWQLKNVHGQVVKDLHFVLRVFFPQELKALLKLSGLATLAAYGQYDTRPFGSAAARQLLLCGKG